MNTIFAKKSRKLGIVKFLHCELLSVLSRNHALIWYENGKFYLQDTKSSNGTFVNNQRLSKGSEESLPREVCSGDILQVAIKFCQKQNQQRINIKTVLIIKT